MIKTLKKIHHKIPIEHKFKKYLTYTFGEIILVVISILIAAQINTWRQDSSCRSLEKDILTEINRNLNKDLDEIQYDIGTMDNVQNACNTILTDIKTQPHPSSRFHKAISKIKRAPHFDPNMSGYVFLQSKGVDIIRNDSLREMISNHYELNYPYYKKYETERTEFKIRQTNPFLMQYFTWSHDSDSAREDSFVITDKDYNYIKDNGSLKKVVAATAWENNLINSRAKELEIQITRLIQLINKKKRRS